jgi:hypothetical protein
MTEATIKPEATTELVTATKTEITIQTEATSKDGANAEP